MADHHASESDSRALPSAAAADALSDVLRTVRLTGALFFLWDARWPYATPVPEGRAFAPIVLPGAQQIISYHIITEGTCWAGLRGQPPLELRAGDILLIPRGDAYVMASDAEECASSAHDFEASLEFFRQMAAGELPLIVADGGGGAETTRVVCGFLGCDMRPFNPLVAALPPLVRVRPTADAAGNRLRLLVDYALEESRGSRPGNRSVLVRLSELLFLEVVRRCLEDLPAAQAGWLAGLRDPVVGRALLLLHRRPAEPWTIERLAEEVGSSRSRLAESFTALVGRPPMQYLAQWRMQLAARMLADGDAKVASAARGVGYDSESAFSRAFKRFVGVSPVEWRRSAKARD